MSAGEAQTVDDVWAGDLLGRRQEAEVLTAYLECAAARSSLREDSHALTIAVDAEYGVGKSYFLRRLKDHLSSVHPVAFVDAWTDDLADEPLTALAATLKTALAPLIKKPKGKKAWRRVAKASGEVAKIVSMGVAKQALAALVTSAGADLLVKTVADLSADSAKETATVLGGIAAEAAEGGVEAFAKTPPSRLMDERIQQFEEGKAAVAELKDGLRALLGELPVEGLDAPIIIIIDELDRCRPTYAIKLLEEIKHLFDVQGLVFVLGVNMKQLAHAVRGAYGLKFDGDAYLRRFVNRKYTLKSPTLRALLEKLLQDTPIPDGKLEFGDVMDPATGQKMSLSALLAEYMDVYGATARDTFQVLDRLQTSVALTGKVPLVLPYLMPLILSEVRTGRRDRIMTAVKPDRAFFRYYQSREHKQIGLQELAQELHKAAQSSPRDLSRRYNQDALDYAGDQIYRAHEFGERAKVSLSEPRNYAALLETVGRFGPRDLSP